MLKVARAARLAALLSTMILAPCASAATWPETEGWTINEYSDACTMEQTFDQPGQPTVVLAFGLEGRVPMYITSKRWKTVVDQEYDLTFRMNGASFSGVSAGIRALKSDKAGYHSNLGPNFIDSLRKSKVLVVVLDGKPIEQLQLTGVPAALEVVNRCLAAKGIKS